MCFVSVASCMLAICSLWSIVVTKLPLGMISYNYMLGIDTWLFRI